MERKNDNISFSTIGLPINKRLMIISYFEAVDVIAYFLDHLKNILAFVDDCNVTTVFVIYLS